MLEQHKIQGMSLDDFMAKYEEQAFELIDGEIFNMTPMKYRHNIIQKRIFLKFTDYESSSKNGEAFSEMPFVLEDTSNWLTGSRVPDVMYYQKSRLETYRVEVPDYEDKPMVLVPDIVVEIILPTDKYSDVKHKVALYIEDDVKIIWVVDPQLQTVEEYTQAKPDAITKRNDDVLSGGDVAEGFELKISEIFAG